MSLQKYWQYHDEMVPDHDFKKWGGDGPYYRCEDVDAELARLREDLERHKRAVRWVHGHSLAYTDNHGTQWWVAHDGTKQVSQIPADLIDIIKLPPSPPSPSAPLGPKGECPICGGIECKPGCRDGSEVL